MYICSIGVAHSTYYVFSCCNSCFTLCAVSGDENHSGRMLKALTRVTLSDATLQALLRMPSACSQPL